MKKRLEAELISIAHRILKLKNKSEVDQLYKETQKLYETLSVLKFYQDNFESVKANLDEDVLEEKLAQSLAEKPKKIVPKAKEEIVEPIAEAVVETEPEVEETPEEVVEDEIEVQKEETKEAPALAFQPIFELEVEDEIEVTEEEEDLTDSEQAEQIEPAETASEVTPEMKQAVVEEFLGEDYVDPVFVKPNEVSLFATDTIEETQHEMAVIKETSSKSIAIGLNDRIGFVKHLFDESNEDFNRVLSQLNTFDSFEEAKNFIDDMVKPDYNNWQGNEDFAERFMELIEHKFQ